MRPLLIVAFLASTAAAQNVDVDVEGAIARAEAASPTLATALKGTLRRARRAVALGPTVGAWGANIPGQDTFEGAVTLGVGLETFKVPVLPEPDTLRDLVIERAKAKLLERALGREDVDQLAREVWEEAVAEVLGLANTRPERIERPAVHAALEVNRTFDAGAWIPRVRLGIGVWKLSLGASFAAALGTDAPKTPLYTGLEVILHVQTSPQPRSSVIDLFLRADFELRDRDNNTDMFAVGARYLLDLL